MYINERGPSLGLGRRRSNIGDQAKDAFWKATLAGKPPLLLLPVDKPRTAASSLADALQVLFYILQDFGVHRASALVVVENPVVWGSTWAQDGHVSIGWVQ